MAKKTYKTYNLVSLDVPLKDEWGNSLGVAVFRGGRFIDSTAKCSLSDEKMQKALEATSLFNRDFYLESVKEEAPAPVVKETPKKDEAPKEEPLTDVKDIRRFKNIVEMRSAMKELGLDIKDDCNYLEAKAIAKKNGYDFQIKK